MRWTKSLEGKWGSRWWIGTALFIALALRWTPTLLTDPTWHPDEFNFVYWPLLFFDGDLNPNFHYYPHFHYYVLALCYALFLAVQSILTGWDFSQAVAHYYFWQTDDILRVGRAVSGLIGAATVVWVALIAHRTEGRMAAIAAAFFSAMAVVCVRQAPLAAADVPMAFWFAAAVWAALRLLQHDAPRDYALAGLCVGLATSCKYNGALVAVAVATAHLQARRPILDSRAGIAGLTALVAFSSTSPYLLVDSARVIEDMRAVASHSIGGRGDLGAVWWHYTDRVLWPNLGGLGALLTLLGLYRTAQHAAGRVLLVSFLTYFIVISSVSLAFVRYALPLTVLQCALAACGLCVIPRPRWRSFLLVAALLQPGYDALRTAQILATQDTRSQAKQWIEEHVPAGTTLANFGGWAGDIQIETFEQLWWRVKHYVRNASYERIEDHFYFFENTAHIRPFYHYAIHSGNADNATGDMDLIREFSAPYAIVHQHPLGASRIDSSFAQQLRASAENVAEFKPLGLANQHYDPLDAYYVPLGTMDSLERPGPAVEIWRTAQASLSRPTSKSPMAALARAYMSGAREALQTGHPNEYVRLSARARRIDHTVRDALYCIDLGNAYRTLGRFRDAIAQYQQAMLFDSTAADAYYNIGQVYRYNLGDVSAALIAWENALSIQPDHTSSMHQLAAMLRAEGQYGEAAQLWQRIIQLEPDKVDAYYHLGIVVRYNMDDPQEALNLWQRAVTLDENHWPSRYNLALGLHEAGRYAEALDQWLRAVQLHPKEAMAHNGLATTYKALGHYGAAQQSWERAVACDPDYGTAHFNLGMLYLNQLGDDSRAREHFSKLLQLQPNHPQAEAISDFLQQR